MYKFYTVIYTDIKNFCKVEEFENYEDAVDRFNVLFKDKRVYECLIFENTKNLLRIDIKEGM